MRKNFFLILIPFIIYFEFTKSNKTSLNNKKFESFCGVDKIKSNVLTNNITEEQRKMLKTRNLAEMNGPINIYLSTSIIDLQIISFSN